MAGTGPKLQSAWLVSHAQLRRGTGGYGDDGGTIWSNWLFGGGTVTGTFTSSAVFLRSISGTLAFNAVTLAGRAGSFTASSIALKPQAGSFPASSVVLRDQASSLAADAVIFSTRSASLTADSIIVTTAAASITSNAIVKANGTGSLSSNAVIRASMPGSVAADAIRKRTMVFGAAGGGQTIAWDTFTTPSDYILQSHAPEIGGSWVKVGTGNPNLGVFAATGYVGYYSGSGGQRPYRTGAQLSNGDVVATFPRVGLNAQTEIVARLKDEQNLNFYSLRVSQTSGQWFLNVIRETVNVVTSLGTFIVNGTTNIKGRLSVNSINPTSVKARAWSTDVAEPGTWGVSTSDSTAGNQISPAYVGIFSLNNGGVLDDFLAVTAGTPVDGPGPTLDALILKPQSGALTAGAVINGPRASSLTANAVVLRSQSGSLTADALLLRPVSGSISANAVIAAGISTVSGSFAANAVIRRAQSATLAADAIRKRTMVFGAGGGGVVAQDDFSGGSAYLTATTADVGGQWQTVWDNSGNYKLSVASGLLQSPSGSLWGTGFCALPVSAGDVDGYLTAKVNGFGGLSPAGVLLRRSGSNFYYAQVYTYPGSGTDVGVYRWTGSATLIASSNLGIEGSDTRLRFSASGVSPTTLKARAWVNGGSEPGSWAVSTTDNTAGSQFALGMVGVLAGNDYDMGPETADDFLVVSSGAAVDGPGPTLDAVIRKPRSASLTASSIVRRTAAGSITASTVIGRTQASSLTSSAWLIRPTTAGLPADAVILRPRTGSLSAASVLTAGRSKSFMSSAISTANRAATFPASAVIRSSSQTFLTADSTFLSSTTSSFTGSSAVRAVVSGSTRSDSIVRRPASATLTAEAIVRTSQAGSLEASAYISGGAEGSFPASAWLVRNVTGTIGGSALVQGVRFATLTASAVVTSTPQSSVTGSAIIGKTVAATFTASAVGLATRTDGIASTAILRSQRQGFLPAAAVVDVLRSGKATATMTTVEHATAALGTQQARSTITAEHAAATLDTVSHAASTITTDHAESSLGWRFGAGSFQAGAVIT